MISKYARLVMFRFLFALCLLASFSLSAVAAIDKSCRTDKAVYAPRGKFGDGRYEMVLEDMHPQTPGGEYVRLHINLYDPKTNVLLTTATMSYGCSANGVITCIVSMNGIKPPIDVVLLKKDLTFAAGDLVSGAPYAILLPRLTSSFWYGVHVGDKNPSVKYLSEPPAMMALPPEIWLRRKCGDPKPSLHFGNIN